jgi:hypothetical protein
MMRLVDLPMAERARAALTTASAVALMVSVAAACSTAHLLSGKHVFPAPLRVERLIMDCADSAIVKQVTVLATTFRRERGCRLCSQSTRKRR